MKKLLTILLAVVLTPGLLSTQAATTFTFQEGANGYAGAKDTQIRFGSPDRDDGALDGINPDKSDGGGEVHALMRFDDIFGTKPGQIPPGSTILQANLTLYLVNPGNSPSLHRVLIPWDESTTWNTWDPVSQDGVTADGVEVAVDPDATFDVPSAGIPYFKVIDLPAKTLQDWLDGKTKNYGWGFIPNSTDGVDFDSSEGAVLTQRPLLTVVVGTAGDAFVKSFASSPLGFTYEIEDGTTVGGAANPINAASIAVTLDGTKVTPTVAKTGNVTTISYATASTAFLAAGSSHKLTLTVTDSATPPKTITDERNFTVATFPSVPASYNVNGVNTAQPGFKARIHQIPVARANGGGDQNRINPAEKQLANGLINPDTGTPFDNEADLTAAKSGFFELPGVINWDQVPAARGNFSDASTPPMPDEAIPGIPGINGSSDNVAAEILTYLDLPAGFHRFGVNSDDGFKVTVGPGSADVFATRLGAFDGGRGAADSVFDFAVEQAGVYPFRLVWWEGGGDANLEFFSVDLASGQKILINDRSNAKAIKAYREGPAATFAPRSGLQTLLAVDDKTMWRYDQSGTDRGTAWRDRTFNDSSWPQGPAILGDESGAIVEPIRTPLQRTTDAGDFVETFYMRGHFNVTGDPKAIQLRLRHVIDDGAIFYLNGTEVYRFGYAAGVTPAFDNASVAGHENEWLGPFEISSASLVAGDNVLAVEVHQSGAGSSDIVFGAELVGLAVAVTPPVQTPSKNALLVIGTASIPNLNASDAGLKTRLESQGWQVAVVQAPASTTANGDGKQLIVISSTVASADVGTKFRNSPVPVINWEQAVQDDFLMTGNAATDHATTDAQTQVNIVKADHPLAAGLTTGLKTVTTAPQPYSWGLPNANAVTIATIANNPAQVVVYGYEKGAALVGNTPAPARRVMFFMGDDSFAALTPDGLKLFDAAIAWAASPPAPAGPILSLARTATGLTLTFGGTLQSADSVAGPWTDVANAASPLSVTVSGTQKFYRAKQ